jgi:DNA polymerase III alpha subunit
MGLTAFTGLAEAAIDGLLAARRAGGPFTNLSDLLARAGLGRAELELLVRGGACDGFELTRPELLWRLACRFAPKEGASALPASKGKTDELFPGSGGLDHLVPRLPEYGLAERCRMEQELFGFPITRHPLELVVEKDNGGTQRQDPRAPHRDRSAPPLITAADMLRHAGRRVRMRGLAISYKRIPTKAGGWMKFLSLEDLTGTFEAVLFPAAYARCAEATLGAGPLLVEGRVDVDQGVPSLAAERIEPVRGGR